jgi:hypothetical protein
LRKPQVPAGPQVKVPVHVSGSSALVTAAQTPGVVPAQVWQVPQLGCSQQTLSTQEPVSQSVATAQGPPCVWYSHVSAK